MAYITRPNSFASQQDLLDLIVHSLRLYLGMDAADAAWYLSDLANYYDGSVFNIALGRLSEAERERVIELLESEEFSEVN